MNVFPTLPHRDRVTDIGLQSNPSFPWPQVFMFSSGMFFTLLSGAASAAAINPPERTSKYYSSHLTSIPGGDDHGHTSAQHTGRLQLIGAQTGW